MVIVVFPLSFIVALPTVCRSPGTSGCCLQSDALMCVGECLNMKMFSALQSSSERDFNQQCFLFVFISEAGEQNLTRTIITVQYNSTADSLVF